MPPQLENTPLVELNITKPISPNNFTMPPQLEDKSLVELKITEEEFFKFLCYLYKDKNINHVNISKEEICEVLVDFVEELRWENGYYLSTHLTTASVKNS